MFTCISTVQFWPDFHSHFLLSIRARHVAGELMSTLSENVVQFYTYVIKQVAFLFRQKEMRVKNVVV